MKMILHLWQILILHLLRSLLCHGLTFLNDQQPLSLVPIKRSSFHICLQEMKERWCTCSFISCTAFVSCRASWISDILAWIVDQNVMFGWSNYCNHHQGAGEAGEKHLFLCLPLLHSFLLLQNPCLQVDQSWRPGLCYQLLLSALVILPLSWQDLWIGWDLCWLPQALQCSQTPDRALY